MKSRMTRFLAVLVLLALLVPALSLQKAEAESYKATVYVSSMKVYASAYTGSKVLATLKKGTSVTVKSVSGAWAFITYNSKNDGYCQLKNLKSSVKTPVYTTGKTKIYKDAKASGAICTVMADYPLYMVGTNGSYYLVEDKDGQFTGYVLKSMTSANRKNPYAVKDSAKVKYTKSTTSTTMPKAIRSSQFYLASNMKPVKFRDYMVFIAQNKLGCKYSTSPNNKTTFSNHSLVQACMSAMGYTIPNRTNTVGHTGSAPYVSRKNLLKGDVVCFDVDTTNANLVDHIGIYVGQGYFIHASSAAGCVVVSTMNSGYYYKAFCWGRRYIPN